MRNRPIGSSEERPVPSFDTIGATASSSQPWIRAPASTPTAPAARRPSTTRRPTGVPRGSSSSGCSVSSASAGVRAVRSIALSTVPRPSGDGGPRRLRLGDCTCHGPCNRPNKSGHEPTWLWVPGCGGRRRELDVANRQLGLITTSQATELGLSDTAVAHRVAVGLWNRRRNGLFAVAGAPESWEQDVMGAVLLAGPLAWASHATSSRLWRYLGDEAEDLIELTTPLEKRVRQRGIVTHRSGLIEERDLRVVRGVPCMSAARTIVDLSSRLSADRLGRLVDDGLRRGVLTVSGLDHEVRRFARIAPGRSPKTLQAVLADRVPGYHATGSDLEQDVFDAIVKGARPAPVRQYKVIVKGEPYYIDMAYPEHRIAIEADGFDVHARRTIFDSDRVRQNDLVNLEWRVLRFTSAFSDERIVADVRRALFGR